MSAYPGPLGHLLLTLRREASAVAALILPERATDIPYDVRITTISIGIRLQRCPGVGRWQVQAATWPSTTHGVRDGDILLTVNHRHDVTLADSFDDLQDLLSGPRPLVLTFMRLSANAKHAAAEVSRQQRGLCGDGHHADSLAAEASRRRADSLRRRELAELRSSAPLPSAQGGPLSAGRMNEALEAAMRASLTRRTTVARAANDAELSEAVAQLQCRADVARVTQQGGGDCDIAAQVGSLALRAAEATHMRKQLAALRERAGGSAEGHSIDVLESLLERTGGDVEAAADVLRQAGPDVAEDAALPLIAFAERSISEEEVLLSAPELKAALEGDGLSPTDEHVEWLVSTFANESGLVDSAALQSIRESIDNAVSSGLGGPELDESAWEELTGGDGGPVTLGALEAQEGFAYGF